MVVADRPEPSADLAAGVPEPELVDDSGARWRSRFDGQRWQVNASHEDYIALRGEPRTRLRYLLALFAKEVALPRARRARQRGGPREPRRDPRARREEPGVGVSRPGLGGGEPLGESVEL